MKLYTELSPDHNTRKLLFKKKKKAFSNQAYRIVTSKHQVRLLEAGVNGMALRKK